MSDDTASENQTPAEEPTNYTTSDIESKNTTAPTDSTTAAADDSTNSSEDAAESTTATATAVETASESSYAFIGRWRGLVSTTNWEKGRIIHEWRQALVEEDAPAGDYSDDAWSQLVGFVTPQHVGRLRRVYHRFHQSHESYTGLYWSHFLAAIDWDDAELWLEGAVQERWSVSRMRRQRWEANGKPEDSQPRDADIVESELDEGAESASDEETRSAAGEDPFVSSSVETVDGYDKSQDSQSDANALVDKTIADDAHGDDESLNDETTDATPRSPHANPLANLPSLAEDLEDVFDDLKVALLRHKATGWEQSSAEDVALRLDALKALVLAPSEA